MPCVRVWASNPDRDRELPPWLRRRARDASASWIPSHRHEPYGQRFQDFDAPSRAPQNPELLLGAPHGDHHQPADLQLAYERLRDLFRCGGDDDAIEGCVFLPPQVPVTGPYSDIPVSERSQRASSAFTVSLGVKVAGDAFTTRCLQRPCA